MRYRVSGYIMCYVFGVSGVVHYFRCNLAAWSPVSTLKVIKSFMPVSGEL